VLGETLAEHAARRTGFYDAVCTFQVLEHVPDVRGFLAAALRAAKVGGVLVCSVPSADSFLSIVEDNVLNLPPHHLSRWSDRSLRKVAEVFGLELVALEHEPLADVHLPLYAAAVIRRSLGRVLGREPTLLDASPFGRALGAASRLLGGLLVPTLREPYLRPVGHSVTAVYRKTKETA
jgi:SAM-dependent methyltransferase